MIIDLVKKAGMEIVAITDSTLFLDLSAKSEGVLDRAELADENGNVSVKEGDKMFRTIEDRVVIW